MNQGRGGGGFKMLANRRYNPNRQLADVVMFSGCSDSQTSSDVGNASSFGNSNNHGKGTAGGACTNALAHVLTHSQGLTFTLSLIHISEPTRLLSISYAVFCLKKKKTKKQNNIMTQIKL
eukprot:TRINITY_DN46638_c0_g1_i1.p1 TRINITY_DN46638_c0_g1~~TRINITY_DN46638_c0_g1_i1.p1  ORF type:complete len:120 (+),score=29.16 TRINITY_DN46638_c0_g1_i1:130-489(+)